MKRPPVGILYCGEYNGYVGFTEDEGTLIDSSMSCHYEKDDVLDNLIEVHGGITFDERNIPYEKFVPEVELTECPKSFEGCRIIGFEVCHFDDGPHHDKEWCKNETMNLRRQIVDLLKNGCNV